MSKSKRPPKTKPTGMVNNVLYVKPKQILSKSLKQHTKKTTKDNKKSTIGSAKEETTTTTTTTTTKSEKISDSNKKVRSSFSSSLRTIDRSYKLKSSEKKRTDGSTARPISKKASIVPKKEDEKSKISCVRIVIIIVSILLACSVIFTINFILNQSSKISTPDSIDTLPNMTKSCQRKHGLCFTAKYKYQQSCDEKITCFSLHQQPILEMYGQRIKLYFLYEKRWQEFVDLEPYTPCEKEKPHQIGWCLGGICQIPKDKKHRRILEEYDNLRVIHGEWQRVESSGEKCLKDFIKKEGLEHVKVDWNKYITRSSSETVFRRCTNPSPQLDGYHCWHLSKPGDWPLFIPTNCSQCHEPPLECNLQVVKKYNDTCVLDSTKFTNGVADTDFKSCCFRGRTIKPGRCLLGECIPDEFEL